MATLEKIRSQQKLLFTIVIIALFLFIVSIASADSIRRMFGPGTTIAKVGSQEVDYNDYRERIDQMNRQQQQQQQMSHEEQSQNVIQQLILESVVNEQIKKLGINVTDAEINNAMTGALPHPAAQRFIQAAAQYLQLPMANGSTVLDAITNPSRYNMTAEQLNYVAQQVFGAPTMADAWAAQERAVEASIQQQALSSLIQGLFTANELDAKSMHNDNSTMTYITYASAPIASVSDDEIEVTDADLKAKYEEVKPMFKLAQETRSIDYIIVPIQPSQQDLNDAELEVDKLVEALNAQDGVDASAVSSRFVRDNKLTALSKAKSDADLRMIPDSMMSKGKVYKYRRMGNTYKVAKVVDVTPQVDSINISMYVAPSKAEADSIMSLLQNGATFKEIAEANGQQSVDSVWQSLVGAPANLVSVFENATVGQAFVYTDSVQNANAVYKVNKRLAPKQYADVAVFSYVVDPSATTVADIKTQLSSFLASNPTTDKFTENADSLYTLRHENITSSTPMLNYTQGYRGATGYNDTRHAIKWAMESKKGAVSPIFEDSRDYYVVATVKDIYDGQYLPWNADNVKSALEALVKSDKKAAKLIEKYQGKANDINGYAQVMGTEVRNDSIVFTSNRLGSIGVNEYALQGQMAGSQKGALVGPVQGANEVVVFVVNDTKENGRPYDYAQDGQAFMNSFGISDVFGMLLGNRKIVNNSLKFENYDK